MCPHHRRSRHMLQSRHSSRTRAFHWLALYIQAQSYCQPRQSILHHGQTSTRHWPLISHRQHMRIRRELTSTFPQNAMRDRSPMSIHPPHETNHLSHSYCRLQHATLRRSPSNSCLLNVPRCRLRRFRFLRHETAFQSTEFATLQHELACRSLSSIHPLSALLCSLRLCPFPLHANNARLQESCGLLHGFRATLHETCIPRHALRRTLARAGFQPLGRPGNRSSCRLRFRPGSPTEPASRLQWT